jgi:predicted transcriptional regulator
MTTFCIIQVKKMPLMIDPTKKGFEKVLRTYQIEAMKHVWNNAKEGATSRQVYNQVNKMLDGGKKISRASIINFLNSMCDEGILNYTEETCKGGTRRKYAPALDEAGFQRYIVRTVFDSFIQDFPNETIEALKESLGSKANDIPGI